LKDGIENLDERIKVAMSKNFKSEQKKQLPRPIIAPNQVRQGAVTFDVKKALDILNDVTEKLISEASQDFIQRMPETVCEILSVPICVLWKFDEDDRKFRIVACHGDVDEEYKKSELDLNADAFAFLFKKNKVLRLVNVNESNPPLSDLDKLNQRKWLSLLAAPLKIKDKAIGILNVYTKEHYDFSDWQKKILVRIANYTALSFQKDEISSDRKKLQTLSHLMLEMTGASSPDQLWELLKKGALQLVGSSQVWIGRLDYLTGELKTVASKKELDPQFKLFFGEGISGQALKDEEPINIGDLSSHPLGKFHIKTEANSRSNLAIPILMEGIPIRQEKEVTLGTKVIGVISIESPNSSAYSDTDEDRLWLLARYAASRFESLELDDKLRELRKVEKALIEKGYTTPKTFNDIIQIVIKGITEILGFEWVNISLVDKERTRIKSEYVVMDSWTDQEINHFKEKAAHALIDKDIQSDIVRYRDIEVPTEDDSRFDQEIFREFHHYDLLRVYIPMISPLNDQVIGTVEVGYNGKYRKYIFEQDIQILKNFVDSAVHALETRKSAIIDTISHEMKSPIIGIRNNASYIQRRIDEITEDRIKIKCEDILMDCSSLLHQVRQIEHFMGRSVFQSSKIERTIVFRDIVIKTINQLKTTIQKDYKFPLENIQYDPDNIKKIDINTDKILLSQVVYNLLINSLRYAEDEPSKFRIRIDVSEEKTTFTLKFKDWGMGIKEEDKNKIFQEGFRSKEAIAKDVRGSGLGLAVSKSIMKQLGGDLVLYRLSKPTEFYVVLPKSFGGSSQ
jgi:signal transduction histidine kinase/GAF domain-containing protein